jgi:hypothetical protein
VPIIVVTPPPRPFAHDSRKRPWLEAIPEADEPREPQRQRLAELPSSSSEDYDTPPDTPARAGAPAPRKFDREDLPSAFGRLALSPDANLPARRNEIPPDQRGEGATEKPGPSKLFQHQLAEAGPPSQRTRQMEKELEKTLLKRYEEAKALEKKKKKEREIKKEQP